jgi:hypothetical protein
MAKQTIELEGMLYGRQAKVQVEVLGECPVCGGWVFDPIKDFKGEPAKSFSCQKWYSKECTFGIWKEFCGKKLSETAVIELLDSGKTADTVKGLKSQKGTIFDSRLMLDKDYKVRLFRELAAEEENKQTDSGEQSDSDGSEE